MLVAVAEVDETAESAPDDEADPGLPGQVVHEVAAGQDGERRDEPDERAAEGAWHVRLRDAQDEDADGRDQERGERADVGHLGDDADGDEARDDRDEDAAHDGDDVRRVVALVDLADARWDHAVAAHGEEDAGLAVEQDEQDGRDAGNGADTDDGGAEVVADVAQGEGDWLRVVELGVGHDARQHAGDDDVEGGADDERADDANRQVVRRVLAFLGARRDGIEADVGEEDDGRAAEDARDAERHEGLPVHRVDVWDGEQQEDGDGRELDPDEDAVELRALLRAADQQDGE